MKKSPESYPDKRRKVTIDLPSHNTWKELEQYGMDMDNTIWTKKKRKRLKKLLDRAFKSLLQKIIRQN